MDNDERQTPFNQQAALEELERFGRDIERYRAQREAIGEQFESFIRSFETPRPSPSAPVRPMPAMPQVPVPAAQAPPVETQVALPVVADRDNAVTPAIVHDSLAGERPAIAHDADLPGDSAAIAHEGDTSAPGAEPATVEPPAPSPAPPRRARSKSAMPVLVGGTLAVFAAGLLAMTLWNRGGESAAPAAVAPETPVAAPDPAAVPATPPPATAIAAPPSDSEITTIRPVWMRVTVDGQRVLEREVPAGTKVPLKAEQSIVIRTGDAGAVQLSIRGRAAEFLGAEGQVVTRTFTLPARAPAGR